MDKTIWQIGFIKSDGTMEIVDSYAFKEACENELNYYRNRGFDYDNQYFMFEKIDIEALEQDKQNAQAIENLTNKLFLAEQENKRLIKSGKETIEIYERNSELEAERRQALTQRIARLEEILGECGNLLNEDGYINMVEKISQALEKKGV